VSKAERDLKNLSNQYWAVLLLATMNTVACAQTTAENPVGGWLAESIRGGGVIDLLQTILEVGADGAISGTGGCNAMRGRATISGDTIVFSSIASTRKACSPAVMDQESKFFAALNDTQTWRVDSVRRKLILIDGKGNPVVVFARM
jgi:putative lipoprotein